MARLEGFRVRNFGVLKDVTLGRLWNQGKVDALTPMIAVIGKNGVGKSTLFDAFGFLADALKSDIDEDNEDSQLFLQSIKAEESGEREALELDDPRKLGIATFGALKQHPRISAFRRFIEGWYLSYFTPDAARSLPLAGPQQHLNIHGDNLKRSVSQTFGDACYRIS